MSQQGAGEARLPAAYVVDIPRGSLFQLIAAWLLLTEGALALLFLPILSLTPEFDVPVGDIATFGSLAVACLIAGGLLYTVPLERVASRRSCRSRRRDGWCPTRA